MNEKCNSAKLHHSVEESKIKKTLKEETLEMMAASFLALVLGLLLATACWSYEPAGIGCHLHSFNVTIKRDPGGSCHNTHTIQACVGYCESSAFPSKYSILLASGFKHNITSVSQCCTISKMQKVKVQLCCGGSQRETMELFTAKACQCDMCRLSRY